MPRQTPNAVAMPMMTTMMMSSVLIVGHSF